MSYRAAYSERVVQKLQDVFLVFDVIHMLALDDLVLFHRFDCVFLGWIRFEPADLHVAERAYPEPSTLAALVSLPSPSESPKTQSSGLIPLKINLF